MLLPNLLYNGANNKNTPSRALSVLFGSQAKTLLLSVRFLAASTNNAALYDNKSPVGDDGGYFGVPLKSNAGVHTLYPYNWDGDEDGNSSGQTVSLDTNYIVSVRHDATNIYLGINGGTETSEASGATSDMTANLVFGQWYGGFMNFEMGEIATYNAAITGSALSDTIQAMYDDWVVAPSVGGRANFLTLLGVS